MPLIIIVILGLVLRLILIGNLPAEMWGDVITHYDLAHQIQSGHFFLNYIFGGDGPLFSYLASVFPVSFNNLLLVTAIIGSLSILTTYVYTYLLFKNKSTALISAFLMSISFWSLTFSRQGKPYILIPLFTSLFLAFLIRKKYILTGLVLTLGSFSQAAFWGLFPPAYFIFSNSYITTKLPLNYYLIPKLLDNIKNNFFSYWWSQDPSFRHTIPHHPYLDPITGVLFALGLLIIIYNIIHKKNWRLFLYWLLPFFLIQIPSLLDMTPGYSTPNMGRMIGLIPLVFALSAHALLLLKPKFWQLFLILFSITIINCYNYYKIYPQTLPNQNIPFGKIIAEYIDRNYPANIPVVLSDCCWGDWGQPEPGAIFYRFSTSRKFFYLRYPTPPYILISPPQLLIYPYADIKLINK